MRKDLELKLGQDFSFMKINQTEKERNIFQRWGFQCGDGWYKLIHSLCQEITEKYEKAGVPVDIVINQVKEKFGTLRFYYSYEDTPCTIHAFDFISERGASLRFAVNNDHSDDLKKQLRIDIAKIVRSYEEKSKDICEHCGSKGELRTDSPWIKTLCDNCYEKIIKKCSPDR